MARRKKNINTIKIEPKVDLKTEIVENAIIETKEEIMTPKISLNEYLSSHNRKKNLDDVIRKWYLIKDKTNPSKTKEDWDRVINEFFGETEK